MSAKTTLWLLGAAVSVALATDTAVGQNPEWRLVRPSNTGIPGESVRFAKFDLQGDMWVSARWPFWGEGGFGVYDFNTQIWTTYANVDTPIPSQWANDVEFAAGGVVWMATSGGLIKKDGDTWTVYDASNSPLLNNRAIRNIELDSAGHIWINNDIVLFEFDGVNWQSFAVPTELPWADPWRSLSGLLVDSNDHVWVANEVLNGVAEYDGVSWILHGAGVNRFGSIRDDLAGNLWLIAGTGGGNAFYKFDGTSFTTFSPANTPFVDTTITTAAADDTGEVYIGNWDGQVIQTTDAGASWSLFTTQNASIFSIAPHPTNNDVWVTTPGAARHLDANGVWIEAFNSYNTGIPFYFINGFALGLDGKFWVSSAEAGVSSFDSQRWFNLGSHNPNVSWPVLADGANCVFIDNQCNVWIGSNGVARWDGQTLTLWDWRNSNLGGASIVDIAQDGSGTMWVGSAFSGVFRFDGSDWVNHLFAPPGWTANEIEALATGGQGNLWVATFLALHMYDGINWNSFDALNNTLFGLGGPNTVEVGPDDTVWIGTDGGLVAFDGVNWQVYNTANSPLPANEIQSIAFRNDGLMAVSAIEFGPVTPFPNGVSLIDGDINNPANWTIYSFENSPIPHYQLGDVKFDANGDLWISALSESAAIALIGGPMVLPGDINADGVVDIGDVRLFAAVLTGQDINPNHVAAADMNGDGGTDGADIRPFVQVMIP